MTRTEDEDVVAYQLTVVLVRCEHISLDAGGSSLGGKRADYVVRLEAVCLQHGNVHGSNDILDDGYGGADVLRRLLALRLIGRESLVAERLAMVERHADMRGMLLGENLVESVHEAHDGRGVHTLGVDSRVLYERIISAIDERVSVEKE